MLYVADQRIVATTTGTGAVARINRAQTLSLGLATGVTEITELGAKYRPGGIDDLGEVRWSISWNSVGIGNIASITSTVVPTAAGASVTIGADQINASTVDILRLIADNAGNVIGTFYAQDCITSDYRVEAAERGVVTETVSGSGPSAVIFPGFIIPKVYVAQAADVTAGYLSLGSILSASEQIVQIFRPGQGQPPSFYQQNGANYFLKIEKVPGGVLTNPPVRYFEHVYSSLQRATTVGTIWVTPNDFSPGISSVGNVVTFGLGTANIESATVLQVASTVNTNSGSSTATVGASTITPASMLGIFPGVSLQTVNANGTNAETVTVTATTGTSFTATFASTKTAGFLITTKAPSIQVTLASTHAAGDGINNKLDAAQGQSGEATYVNATGRLYLGDAFVAGDAFRLVIMSYNTDTSLPTVIPNNPDTTDRPGVNTRLTPLKINGLNANRVSRASFAMSLRRDHVNGIGEPAIVYGISGVPDVAIDMDVRETDLSLLNQLAWGTKNLSSQGGTIANDFQDLNYVTRLNLANAVPASITLSDPFDATKTLCTWNSPQVVTTDITYSSTGRADNTVRITARDITGNFTITATNAQ